MARNHIAVLEAAGLTLEDIASGCVYLRDMKDYEPMNAVYRPYFSRGVAVRTCLMPNSSYEKNDILVRASFIAARRGSSGGAQASGPASSWCAGSPPDLDLAEPCLRPVVLSNHRARRSSRN